MRVRRILLATIVVSLMMPLGARAERRLPRVKPATAYPNMTVHRREQVAIAAVPYETARQQRVFAIPYRKFGFLPIRLIITNLGSRPISLEETRVYLITAGGARLDAATPEDVERNIPLSLKRGRRIPLGPMHVPTHAKDSDRKLERDFRRFEYNAVSVAPHATHAGFIWYDVNGLGKDPLRGASLIVRQIENARGQQLFYFRVPLDNGAGR